MGPSRSIKLRTRRNTFEQQSFRQRIPTQKIGAGNIAARSLRTRKPRVHPLRRQCEGNRPRRTAIHYRATDPCAHRTMTETCLDSFTGRLEISARPGGKSTQSSTNFLRREGKIKGRILLRYLAAMRRFRKHPVAENAIHRTQQAPDFGASRTLQPAPF